MLYLILLVAGYKAPHTGAGCLVPAGTLSFPFRFAFFFSFPFLLSHFHDLRLAQWKL